MPLSYKSRRRWALLILLIGLPLYIVVAVTLMNLLFPDPLAPPPFLAELAIYIGLGILWALPFKFIFRGVGQADPQAEAANEKGEDG
ncbi:DUF2842 domain-containing protein [Actibacterium ureilyticum]|uniref:DUF2842 domain-containing protein n=1 Tax=Actibacterium ureilyticum TaxID=1590614 RepID=UPI000BAAAC8F|nr:DUF2842 domain-containing protein [Actibacterium ureilyticum]